MATSGTITLVYTRDEIIQEALEQLQVIEPGETPSAANVTSIARTLEMMGKAWQMDGIPAQVVQRSYLFPSTTEREYTLSASTSDRWAESYVRTTVDGDVASGASAIDVASITGIGDTYIIGVYQSDGTMLWTTVNGAPSGTTVTLSVVLTAAVDDGAVVYAYPTTAKAGRPMEIHEIWERDWAGDDRPISLISRNEYAELTLKENTGGLVSAYYDPQIAGGNLFLWPIPEDSRMIVGMWVKRTVENFGTASIDVAYPQEAFLALAFNLAFNAMNKFAVPADTMQYITAQAALTYKNYRDYAGMPEAPVTFEPDMEGCEEF